MLANVQSLIMFVAIFLMAGFGLYYTNILEKIPHIRSLAALEAIDEGLGRTLEEGRRAHFGLPTANPGQAASLAGLSIMGYFAKRAAQQEVPVTYSVSLPPIGYAIMEGSLRETYAAEGKQDLLENDEFYQFRIWMGTGPGAADTYALALQSHMMRENIGFNCLGIGLPKVQLMIGETNQIVNAFSVVAYPQPSHIEWAIIGFDYVLMLQEVYAAGAMLSKDPKQLAHVLGLDMATWSILALTIVSTAIATVLGTTLENILVG